MDSHRSRRPFEAEAQGLGAAFSKSIRIVSGASGGSVGLLHFLNAYNNNGLISQDSIDTALKRSFDSSLDAVSWGLVFPDFIRAFFPLRTIKDYDRGGAIEKAWWRGRNDAWMRDWIKDARSGVRPAVVFNATLSESGERFVISTMEASKGRQSFYNLYPEFDVQAVTGARLSATFPYIFYCCPDFPPEGFQ